MRKRDTTNDGLGCGCILLILLAALGTWVGILYTVLHFVLKYW